MLTIERLHEVLAYDPETGTFEWKPRQLQRWNKKHLGRSPGSRHNAGYIHICIDGTKYLAHRLAWLYVHGEWPSQIDHRDLDKTNNRIANLRLVDALNNSANVSVRKRSASGFRGVWFRKDRAKWVAQIHRDGIKHHLGTYKTKEEAAGAYARAAQRLYGSYCPVYLEPLQ